MKYILTVIVLTIGLASQTHANDVSPNEMIKQCLDVWGYDRNEPDPQKRLDQFDFRNASKCVAGFRYEYWQERIEADREFVKTKPWFRGTNWKWEERAEYTCTKEYHTGMTICRKPYYVN